MNKFLHNRILAVFIWALAGAILGVVGYQILQFSLSIVCSMIGALIGALVGLFWPELLAFALRHRIADWRLEEIEIQGLTFSSAGAQRRVAWKLFVEMATRISTQPMDNDEGNDGIALESLYKLFQLTRTLISEMELTPNATGDTVETYALDMLNSDLRPFMAKWHPRWDVFKKSNPAPDAVWPDHEEFRDALKKLQNKIEQRARGLAKIAGMKNVDRYFNDEE